MNRPHVSAAGIGREGQPLVTIDGFAAAPDALRDAARTTRFEPAGRHYPGIRGALPDTYLDDHLPIVTRAIREIFGRYGAVHLLDARFSMVTVPPAALSLRQRIPHCDAYTADRIALVHYLSPEGGDGTAFFRHRSTGFETIDDSRRPAYFDRLDSELNDPGSAPVGYISDDTKLFERFALAEGHYNRALLYPSFLLHSGAITPECPLSPDPAVGRLTVTAFFSVA